MKLSEAFEIVREEIMGIVETECNEIEAEERLLALELLEKSLRKRNVTILLLRAITTLMKDKSFMALKDAHESVLNELEELLEALGELDIGLFEE